MRQKILLSAALMHNPRLVLLDEPFSGLDVGSALVLRSLIQAVCHFTESLAERLHEEFILAFEMLVKTSVGQAGAPHDGCNRGAGEAFGAHAPRGVLHNLVMNFDFVLGLVTHGLIIGCWQSSHGGNSSAPGPTKYSETMG